MKNRVLRILTVLVLAVLIFDACKKEELQVPIETPIEGSYDIKLKWYISKEETKQDFETGLKWGFSFLGASLPKGSWVKATSWESNSVITINFKELGFSENALKAIGALNNWIKDSDEYRLNGSADAGKWIIEVFNNSDHYYQIVDVPKQLNDFILDQSFLKKKVAIVESAVSFGERIITMPTKNDWFLQKYLAEELSGSLKDGSHAVKEYEVMDVMENGQLRYAVYNLEGNLINGADSKITQAGKPAKCVWCHEVNIQPGFFAKTDISGYFTHNEFDSIVKVRFKALNDYRATLNSEIDFTKLQDHAEFEKIYTRFQEPSAQRLAQEWNMSLKEVNEKLANIKTHINLEYPILGNLYYRYEVQHFSKIPLHRNTTSLRETDYLEKSLL